MTDMKQAETPLCRKIVSRHKRKVPEDRWYTKGQASAVADEIAELMKNNRDVWAENARVEGELQFAIDKLNEARAEIEAFRASGAASMETHTTEET